MLQYILKALWCEEGFQSVGKKVY